MKVVKLESCGLADCIDDAQEERLLITRAGEPIVLLIGVKGMDQEQIALGTDDGFWKLIKERRSQSTMTREELEKEIEGEEH